MKITGKKIFQQKYYIYAIMNKNIPAYIGFTTDIKRREKEHEKSIENEKIREFVLVNGLDIFVLATFYDRLLALEYEMFLIKKYSPNLLNRKIGTKLIKNKNNG